MPPSRRPRRLAAGAVLLLAALAACAVNPVTGKKELMLIGEATEVSLGQSSDQGIRSEYGLYQDARLSAYVERVARRMLPYVHRKGLAYHFAVLDTPVVNAFAAPGGWVYVTRGILALMNSEAELATVLGHELGHVNARHSARQMSNQLLLMGGVLLGSALSKDVAKAAPFLLLGSQVLMLKFSRDDEYQADRLGVEYSRAGNYSPAQMIPFFGSMQKLEAQAGGGLRPPNFLSTHPLTAKRIEQARAMLLAGDEKKPVLRNEYLAGVDGLVYGEDPRQGYVEAGAFYHPGLRFAFAVPDGWKVQNSAKQVMLVSADQKAIVLLQSEASPAEPQAYAAGKLKGFTDTKVTARSSGAQRINGLSAFRGVYDLSPLPNADGTVPEGQTTTMDLGCIRKDGSNFTFVGAAERGDYAAYAAAIERTIRSFRPLADAGKLGARPRRLAVRAAGRTAPLRDVLADFKVPEKQWKSLELLNGTALTATVEKGRLVKVIE